LHLGNETVAVAGINRKKPDDGVISGGEFCTLDQEAG
jgi:hypothetical protein